MTDNPGYLLLHLRLFSGHSESSRRIHLFMAHDHDPLDLRWMEGDLLDAIHTEIHTQAKSQDANL